MTAAPLGLAVFVDGAARHVLEIVCRVLHRVQRRINVDQQLADIGQVLVLVLGGIENVQDQPHEKLAGGLIPEIQIARFRAERIDQHADDILDVGDLHRSFADLEHRIPSCRVAVGRREIDDVAEALPVVGRDVPDLTFAVVGEQAPFPAERGRDDVSDAFPRSRRTDDQAVFDTAIGQPAALIHAENAASRLLFGVDQFGLHRVVQRAPGIDAEVLCLGLFTPRKPGNDDDREHRDGKAIGFRQSESGAIFRAEFDLPFEDFPRRIEASRAAVVPAFAEIAGVAERGRDMLGGEGHAQNKTCSARCQQLSAMSSHVHKRTPIASVRATNSSPEPSAAPPATAPAWRGRTPRQASCRCF